MLQPAQTKIVEQVLQANGTASFLDAVGGAGETCCETLILSALRSEGGIAVAVATSGIAATFSGFYEDSFNFFSRDFHMQEARADR